MNDFLYCQKICSKDKRDECFVLSNGSIRCLASFFINHINDLSFLVSYCKNNKNTIAEALQEKKFEGYVRRAEIELLEINKFLAALTNILNKKSLPDFRRESQRVVAPPFMSVNNISVGGVKIPNTYKVVNMSMGGCFIDINAFEHKINIGDHISFDMCLKDNCILGVQGTIKHISSFMKKQGVGVEFASLSDFEAWKNHLFAHAVN